MKVKMDKVRRGHGTILRRLGGGASERTAGLFTEAPGTGAGRTARRWKPRLLGDECIVAATPVQHLELNAAPAIEVMDLRHAGEVKRPGGHGLLAGGIPDGLARDLAIRHPELRMLALAPHPLGWTVMVQARHHHLHRRISLARGAQAVQFIELLLGEFAE